MQNHSESLRKHGIPQASSLETTWEIFSVASGCAPIKKDSFLIESDMFSPGARSAAGQDVAATPDLSGHEAGSLSARKPKAGLALAGRRILQQQFDFVIGSG